MKIKPHDKLYSSVVQDITLACVTSVIREGEGEGENVTKKETVLGGGGEQLP